MKMFLKYFTYTYGDMSKHRAHTTLYEDLCM